VQYRTAPDLFCLDLFKYFDVDRLAAIATGVKIDNSAPVNTAEH
jgi:hypothetical protein